MILALERNLFDSYINVDGLEETPHISPMDSMDLFFGLKLTLNCDNEPSNLTYLTRFGRNITPKFDWVLIVYKLNIFISLEPLKLKTNHQTFKSIAMKKLFSILVIASLVFVGTNKVQASSTTALSSNVILISSPTATALVQEEAPAESESFHQELKQRFIEGGPGFMGIVLLCLILGLAIAIERIIYLNLSTTNTAKLAASVEEAIKNGGVSAAKEVCRDTKGPVASIYYQGLDRADESVDAAEKAVVAYGGVQMGQLEKNVSWISLFIALAPMLGFMGTVIGMIQAFDKIQAAGDMNPSLVAGGIKVALLTTVFGLIVAIILQIFYNYIVAKIDSIVNNMEDASITLIDILVAYKNKK